MDESPITIDAGLASALVERRRKYVPARYVFDGDTVLIRWDSEGAGLRCKVACAAGNHARVVNEHYGVDRWLRVEDLYVPSEDPRA